MPMTTPAAEQPRTLDTLRASLTPWPHAVVYVGLFLAGIGLWVLGTRGPESLQWAKNFAWVAFAADVAIILYWQRQAARAASSSKG
ncbi:hypothetical protein FA014_09345 [Cellulomonas hominis]|uniref:Uncharacterized protein n=1 Tax=Cellulomonas hominis TaxID=156981 RepID=A0A7Z8NS65_9CELL|nr:hypothetical protein [Cellulomonas hominis]TKR23796.1 hypothetical protein FA014_09345 [Cellulomonas hominis]